MAGAPAWRSSGLPITIGISARLLGEEVRDDGSHKQDSPIAGVLGRWFTWVPVCPEVEVGMGTPQEPIRLAGDPRAPRLLGVQSGADHTAAMTEYVRRRAAELARCGLSGYILKRASPSCGMERVTVYTPAGMPSGSGTGLFARALLEALPRLPAEEEGRLAEARLRDNFITRVFATGGSWRSPSRGRGRPTSWAFHTSHKYLLLSHSPGHYARLGQMVAAVAKAPRAEVAQAVSPALHAGPAGHATPRKHVNVLQPITGFFTRRLDTGGTGIC
jgi:uncharacterized protein YbbK (DUF523 family)